MCNLFFIFATLICILYHFLILCLLKCESGKETVMVHHARNDTCVYIKNYRENSQKCNQLITIVTLALCASSFRVKKAMLTETSHRATCLRMSKYLSRNQGGYGKGIRATTPMKIEGTL
ncbi:hypothetical protein VNO77_42972 [Canavalia gladiata]|uniref:Uncharacterized protein n=1 Tax=Canavalia gladiata TaxID=3824 RepID=A0AAN9PPM1_CANGL